MKHKNLDDRHNDLLNSCILVESTKISRKITIPHQVCFCLDDRLLALISQNQTHQAKFALSAINLANLRHYALCHFPWSQRSIFAQSGLTFSTEYSFDSARSTVFRSVISLEGKISQQIKQELAQNPSLLNQISQAHYWLIAEILAQLPFKSRAWHSWLLVSSLAIAIIINILIWYLIPLNYLPKLSICLGFFLLLISVLTILITNRLQAWIIYHLLDGLLAKSIVKRQIVLKVLSFLV